MSTMEDYWRALAAQGADLRLAREHAVRKRDRLRQTVRLAYSAGIAEAELARRAGVDRMTVRAWLGKRPANRPIGQRPAERR